MTETTASTPSVRQQQIEARRQRLIDATPQPRRVRVNPASDLIRKFIRHPSGVKFPPGSGSVEWPLDGFTKRRLRDGSVTREGAEG